MPKGQPKSNREAKKPKKANGVPGAKAPGNKGSGKDSPFNLPKPK